MSGSAEPPARCLLLNATMEPLCIVTMRRAVVLVMTGKAQVVDSGGMMLHSQYAAIPAPVVASLTRYVHVPYRGVAPPARRTVLVRDGYRCAYCGCRADTMDHVVPRSRGGAHRWTNVVAACEPCNHRKADRLLTEIGWTLLYRPTTPRGPLPLLAADPRAAWRPYLTAAA